jgi:uncharacterized membrane protein YgdD (TMEM256/DUF423 family)
LRTSVILLLFLFSINISAQFNYHTQYSFTNTNQLLDNSGSIKYSIIHPVKFTPQNHSALNIGGQFLVGSTLSFVFIIPSAIIGYASAWNRSTDLEETAIGIFAISSYLFGATVGVHWIAKAENTNLSFWKTAVYSAMGGGVSALLIAIASTQKKRIPSVVSIIAASFPVLGAMFYSSFISDWSDQRKEISSIDNNLTLFSLIEQSQIFKIELLHIRL